MERIWLRSYPPGVPAELELDPQRSLVSMLEDACARFPDAPAFTNFGRTITYAELDELSARFASALQNRLGLRKGDRVALMMPNLLQYPIALLGTLRAGLVVVNVNPLYTPRELHHQLDDSGARAIVIVANAGATLAEVINQTPVEHVVVTGIGDMLGFPKRQVVNFAVRYVKRLVPPYRLPGALSFDAMLQADRRQLEPPAVAAQDLAFLQYTGGTTGLSKGAMLSHGNMVANVNQINVWFSSICKPGEEIVITALPLYHVYALTCNCFAYLDLGGHNILITDPRDTRGFVAELGKWRFNTITGVNTLYQSLVDYPDFAELDFSSLKIASAGGMAVMDFTARAWAQLTGTEIIEGYGLSETSPVVTSNRPDLEAYTGCIGLPLPSTEVSLRDDAGQEVPMGEPGELCVRGPQVMAGYWGKDESTNAVMTDDNYLKTGDVATVDEHGYFKIVDRKKDMILVSGFNVYPNEIENILTLHDDVAEAAVIGMEDAELGEIVKAFVVVQPGARIDAQGLREFCRQHLARYKIPKQVEFRDELPKSNVGKILRRALRDEPA
ncbi:MAG: AMP-binding protein [Chromatiales bacterium]|nr:MAG: AMP-binding protein [Chromatiales bacterium]